MDHVSQGKGTKEVACFPSTKYGIINGLQNYQFPPSCYLSVNPIICTNHIIPRSDEDVRRGKIFLFYETGSHAVICPLYDALVPGFPVEYFTGVFQFNGCVEHCDRRRVRGKWKLPVSQQHGVEERVLSKRD